MGSETSFGSGIFCISLDFELYYGVSDLVSAESFQARVDGARRAVPALLRLFADYEVHATWATVGMLFPQGRDELAAAAPRRFRPSYSDGALSNYRLLSRVGPNEQASPALLAPSLISRIRETPGQELATHTFSHFYALEPGASLEAFEADLWAAIHIAEERGERIESIVFPRNQYSPAHLEICRRVGLRAFRGNPPQWMHAPAGSANESRLRQAARLLDAHLPLSASNLYGPADLQHPSGMANVPASRFLRPVDAPGALPALLNLRIRRELRRTAESGRLYHLWWHPHNFGGDLERNLGALRRLLDAFATLRTQCGMRSLTMGEIAKEAGIDEENRLDCARQRADAAVS